jgi:hypothetical protein
VFGVTLVLRERPIRERRELFRREDDDGHAAYLDEFFALEAAQHAGDGLARTADQVGEFLMGQGHGETHFRLAAGGSAAPVEQHPGEASGGGAGEGEPACVEEGGLVFLGERLGGMQAGLAVALQEFEKFLAADFLDFNRLQGLGGDFVFGARDDRAEAKHIAGHGDLQDQGAAFALGAGKLDLPGADDIDAVAGGSLLEQEGAFGQLHLGADGVEIGERGGVQIAEHAQRAELTGAAIARLPN